METQSKIPLTNYQRVRRAKLKAVAAGGRRAPDGIMPKDVAQAIDELIDADYAGNSFGVVCAAVLDAHKKISRKAK